MIRVEDLRYAYPTGEFSFAIRRFAVEHGKTVAIIGPSGSGKSTFLNLIAGVLKPDEGTVEIDGTAVSGLSDRRRRAFRVARIGFVFQDFGLMDYLTARENILYPFRLSGSLTLSRQVRERAQALADRLSVGHLMRRRPEALSQGEKQRIAICRALLPKPGVVLADEATGNLDPANKHAILDVLFEMVASENTSLVAVTHDHDLLSRFDSVFEFGGQEER